VTERCQGTLKDLVLGRREELGISYDAYAILRQTTKGLKHLHEKGIVHRDLKPANILVSYPIHGDQPLMKLADFGLCHVVQNSDQSEFCFSKIAGTEGWMAPEMHYKEITERFTYLVDIFPLGLIFAFTLSGGQHPYGSSSIDRVNRIINNEPMTLTEDQLGEHATYNVFELIKSMLNYEPKQRPCASAILHHQFLNRVKQQQLLDVLVYLSLQAKLLCYYYSNCVLLF
jgi:serine/threonine-protein kinase/endoribonuclease IRE1